MFEEFAAKLGTATADLEEITAPEDVADLDEVVQNLRALEDEATADAEEIRSGGAAAIAGVVAQFLTEANRIGIEIDSTIGEINSKLQG